MREFLLRSWRIDLIEENAIKQNHKSKEERARGKEDSSWDEKPASDWPKKKRSSS